MLFSSKKKKEKSTALSSAEESVWSDGRGWKFLRHRILLRPFFGVLVVAVLVRLVDARYFGHERILRIGIAQQRAYGEEHFGYGERRRPLWFEYVQTNAAVTVYIRMVNSGRECNLNRNLHFFFIQALFGNMSRCSELNAMKFGHRW